jgi:hypothetical protein
MKTHQRRTAERDSSSSDPKCFALLARWVAGLIEVLSHGYTMGTDPDEAELLKRHLLLME